MVYLFQIKAISQNKFCSNGNHSVIVVTEAGLNKELIPYFGFILKSDSKKVHFIQKVNWVRLG